MAWLLLAFTAVFVLFLFFIWKLSNIAIEPKPSMTMEAMRQDEFARYGISNEDWDKNWARQEETLQSGYGYPLYLTWIPRAGQAAPDGRERVAVIVHGHGVNHYCSVKYAALFHKFGFQVVLYDHRNHGRSGKALTTMGRREADDLCTVCAWARRSFGEDCLLGTHGESMGAATVMLHSAMDSALAFVVEDCGYSSLKRQLAYVMKTHYHLPPKLFLPPTFLLTRLRTGVWFQTVEPAEAVRQSGQTPMLFIHGEADTYVPYFMLAENYAAKTTGPKQLESFPGAKHAQSFHSDPLRYEAVLRRFLEENHIL